MNIDDHLGTTKIFVSYTPFCNPICRETAFPNNIKLTLTQKKNGLTSKSSWLQKDSTAILTRGP